MQIASIRLYKSIVKSAKTNPPISGQLKPVPQMSQKQNSINAQNASTPGENTGNRLHPR